MTDKIKRLPKKLKEKDYRLRKDPSHRATSAQNAIRAALKNGKERFGDLEKETKLSRPALAANLKKMHKSGEIERSTDAKDYRVTRYFLTDKGLKEYEKQKDLETLQNMEFMPVGRAMEIVYDSITRLLTNIDSWPKEELRYLDAENREVPEQTDNAKYTIRKTDDIVLPSLSDKEQEILQKCLGVSIYSSTPRGTTPGFVETLRELLTLVKQIAASKDVDIGRLKSLPDLTFMFEFSRDLLLYQYENLMKTKEQQTKQTGS
jgi:DNA-binding MarR family transcriptional regulator